MRLNFSIPVFALLFGAGLGFCLAPRTAANDDARDAAKEDSTVSKKPSSLIADASSSATVESLRARIKELERQLAQKHDREDHVAMMPRQHREPPRRQSPREMMEEFKKNDPARYAEMTNNMARWRQERLDRAQEKIDFLSSIDVNGMGRQERRSHERLERMLALREELESALHNPDITDEERHDTMRQLFDTDRQISELNSKVRANLIAETIKELGYIGDDANAISETISEIISATESAPHGPPRPPREMKNAE